MKICSSCKVAALCVIGHVWLVKAEGDLHGLELCAAFLRIPIGPRLVGTRRDVSNKCPRNIDALRLGLT